MPATQMSASSGCPVLASSWDPASPSLHVSLNAGSAQPPPPNLCGSKNFHGRTGLSSRPLRATANSRPSGVLRCRSGRSASSRCRRRLRGLRRRRDIAGTGPAGHQRRALHGHHPRHVRPSRTPLYPNLADPQRRCGPRDRPRSTETSDNGPDYRVACGSSGVVRSAPAGAGSRKSSGETYVRSQDRVAPEFGPNWLRCRLVKSSSSARPRTAPPTSCCGSRATADGDTPPRFAAAGPPFS